VTERPEVAEAGADEEDDDDKSKENRGEESELSGVRVVVLFFLSAFKPSWGSSSRARLHVALAEVELESLVAFFIEVALVVS
jgi:hypothetical protein